jgi:hypothetical protein
MKYSVWLFTRPIDAAMSFDSTAVFSNGKIYLCHWGVLVNEMGMVDVKVIVSRVRKYGANDNTDLGIMYEIHRGEDNKHDLAINQKIGINSIKEKWPMFSIQYVGESTMTHDIIKEIGVIYILRC